MAKIRITHEKDGTVRLVEDNDTTRKAIKNHNTNAREGHKWFVDKPTDPRRLTMAQKLAMAEAELAQLKAEKEKAPAPADTPTSTAYDEERAIQVIDLIDNIEDLTAFCKGERRAAVTAAKKRKLETLNP